MTTLNLDDLKSFSNGSVFALVNREENKIYLAQSSNTLLAIALLLDKLKSGVFRYRELVEDYRNNKLELQILDTSGDELVRKVRLRELQDRYRNLSWRLYNRFKSSRYRIRMYVSGYPHKIELWLISNSGTKLFVAAFNNQKEADEFYTKHYKDVEYPIPVYGDNELSRECIRMYNTKVYSNKK